MEDFSPALSHFWRPHAHAGETALPATDRAARESVSLAQQVALDELADRINAARSVS